jgi:hypothetical protein
MWWLILMGCLVPYSNLGPTVVQIRGHGALLGSVLSHHVRMVSDALLEGTQPPTLDACESIDCLTTCITDFYIEYVTFYLGMVTLCRGCYDAYKYIPDGVTITDSDGMGPCIQVYAAGCTWVFATMPHHRQVMSAPTPEATVLAMLIRRMEALEWDGWMPGSLLGRGK